MTAYLDPDGFKLRSLAPSEFIDEVEATAPGWLETQLDEASRFVDSRLRKRYAAPFEPVIVGGNPTYPPQVLSWVSRLVTMRLFLRRGVDPRDRQFDRIEKDHDEAKAEIMEAANSQLGLFDLPLIDSTSTAVSKGGPRSYSEQSPYVAFASQRRSGREEDRNGGGTRR